MISFIIPTLNEEKTIEATLKCIAGYSGEYEIIVSDGKSKDRTIEISRRYTDKVLIYDKPERQTIAMARNAGAAAAKGDILVFMDADVTILDINAFFKKTEAIFHDKPHTVAVTVYYRVLPEFCTFADAFFFKMLGWNFLISNNLFRLGAAAGEFQMIRKEAFNRVGGFNEKFTAAEDMDLFRRLSKIGRTRFEGSLAVYHTGRRAHQVGWPKLLSEWFANTVSVALFKRSASKEWKEIR